MKYLFCIGIDPGTNTGWAVWNVEKKCFDEISTLTICEAMDRARKFAGLFRGAVKFSFEDMRKRKWVDPRAGKERLRGIGSVSRDCSIWEEFLRRLEVDFRMVHPKNISTKMDDKRFAQFTGHKGRTSEHGRDAAMQVFGM